jgi:hypothetical protein
MTEADDDNVISFELGQKRERIVAGVGELFDTDDPQKITYSHSVMCQTSMPFKNEKGVERWEVRNGNSFMVIRAGEVYDPNKDAMVQLGLPYGTKPRLILLDWNRQAVLNQSPVIEVEDTLYAFLKRLRLPTEGRVYNMAKKQLSALAASQMTIGRPTEQGGGTHYRNIVSDMNILFSKDENQRILWPNTVKYSDEYFASLMRHAVPLDEGALYLLKDSALELDLYAMFAERLHRIDPKQPQFVHWAGLWEQYGQGYKRINNFRAKFRQHLLNVRAVYHEANIEEISSKGGMPKGLLLKHSKPPVAKVMVTVAKPVEKPVEG